MFSKARFISWVLIATIAVNSNAPYCRADEALMGLVQNYVKAYHDWQNMYRAEAERKAKQQDEAAQLEQKKLNEAGLKEQLAAIDALAKQVQSEKEEMKRQSQPPKAGSVTVDPPPAIDVPTMPASDPIAALQGAKLSLPPPPTTPAQATIQLPPPPVPHEDIEMSGLDAFIASQRAALDSDDAESLKDSACGEISALWNGGTTTERLAAERDQLARKSPTLRNRSQAALAHLFDHAATLIGDGITSPGVHSNAYNEIIANLAARYVQVPEDRDALSWLFRCISMNVSKEADSRQYDPLDNYVKTMDFMSTWGWAITIPLVIVWDKRAPIWKYVTTKTLSQAVEDLNIGNGMQGVDSSMKILRDNVGGLWDGETLAKVKAVIAAGGEAAPDAGFAPPFAQLPSGLDVLTDAFRSSWQTIRGAGPSTRQAAQDFNQRFTTLYDDAKNEWLRRAVMFQNDPKNAAYRTIHTAGQGLEKTWPAVRCLLRELLVAGTLSGTRYFGGINTHSEPPKFPPVQLLKLVQPLLIGELEGKAVELSKQAEKLWRLATDPKGSHIDLAKVRANRKALTAGLPLIENGNVAPAHKNLSKMDLTGVELGLVELREELAHFEGDDAAPAELKKVRHHIVGEPDYGINTDIKKLRELEAKHLERTSWTNLRWLKPWKPNEYYATSDYRMASFLQDQRQFMKQVEAEERRLNDVIQRDRAAGVPQADFPNFVNISRVREELEIVSHRLLEMREALAQVDQELQPKKYLSPELYEKMKLLGMTSPTQQAQ